MAGLLFSVAPGLGGDRLAVARRADLARSYVRFEHTFRDHPPEERLVAGLNRDFDAATLSFFTMRFADALEKIDGLSWRLLPENERLSARALAWSLRITADPPVLVAGSRELRLRVESLYLPSAAQGGTAVQLRLRLRNGAGPTHLALDYAFRADPASAVELDQAVPSAEQLKPGPCQIEITDDAGEALTTIPFYVVEKSLDSTAVAFRRRLAALKPDTDAQRQAVEICRARVGLLADEPSEFDSAQFLANPLALTSEIETELRTLEQRKAPYRNKCGDYWRVIVTATARIPMRIYAPRTIANGKPPLLVAFHGAGGDENMFMDGYGAGAIVRLAEKQGILIASPATASILRDISSFKSLLDGLALDYEFDPRRVYVLGHSMGAAAAVAAAAEFPNRIAGIACIAGGGNWQAPHLPPTQLVIAELDAVAGADRLARAAAAANSNGAQLEVVRIKDHGHTLVVGHVLENVWTWLSQHKTVAD